MASRGLLVVSPGPFEEKLPVWRRSPRSAHQWHHALVGICLFVSACASPRPDVQPESDIASAAGVHDAVTFRTQGDPVHLDGPEVPDLTISDAVRRALSADPGIQIALSQVRVALAASDQARLLPNPILTILFRFPVDGGKTEIDAGLSADLLAVLQRNRRTSAADQRLMAACAGAVRTALDVVLLVRELYARAQAVDALIPLLEARRGALDQLIKTARARLDAGEGTQVDVDGLAMQKALVDLDLEQRRLERRESRLGLARLLGQPKGAAAWRIDGWRDPEQSQIDESRWIETALTRRPELQSIVWELAALGDDLALAGVLGALGLAAGVGAERGQDIGWSLGPSASAGIPLFDTGQARRDRVTAEIIAKRHELVQASRRVIEEVRVALESYRYALRVLENMRQEVLPLKERRRRQVEKAFVGDEVDLTALLVAEQEAKAAQAKRVDLEQLAAISLARLERAVGGAGVAKTLEPVTTRPAGER